MGFLKRLFCSHNYIFVRDFVAYDGSLSSAWRCGYCGKEISKRGQSGIYASEETTAYASRQDYESGRNDHFMSPKNAISHNNISNDPTLINDHKANDCQPSSHSGHSHDYGDSSYSSSDSCSSSSDSSSGSSD